MRPDDFGMDGFGKIKDAREFGKRAKAVNDVSAIRGTADALLRQLILAPFVKEEIVGIGSTLDVDGETGVDERFGHVTGGPVDEEDGVGVLEDFIMGTG